MTPTKTLGEFIIENQNQFAYSTGELSRLLNAIRLASKTVNHEVNKAGLVDIIGVTDKTNHSNEIQQKLDVFANQAFKNALTNRDIVCGFASEEEESYIELSSAKEGVSNNYIVLIGAFQRVVQPHNDFQLRKGQLQQEAHQSVFLLHQQ